VNYQDLHNAEWGLAPKVYPTVPGWVLQPIKHGADAMIVISADSKFAEPGKHPVIGSEWDHQNVLRFAREAKAVIMGYGTAEASRFGIECETLYIATRNPAAINYELPLFKRKNQQRILVSPIKPDMRPSDWSAWQNSLPSDALILGGPALMKAYCDARLLRGIEVTVAPFNWPNGILWQPTFPTRQIGGLTYVRHTSEAIVELEVLYGNN